MPYVNFVSDEYLKKCVRNLFEKYQKSFNEVNLEDFYKNKIDPIKMGLDMIFNHMDMEEWIISEISRQKDKAINNAIGDFHQEVFDGIDGIEAPKQAGYDIKATNNTMFAELKNKHNTLNSSSTKSTFEKLAAYADQYQNATCYLVQIIAKKSIDEQWVFTQNNNGVKRHFHHPRVRIISADLFYEMITGDPLAFKKLCDAIPVVANEIMQECNSENKCRNTNTNKIYEELLQEAGSEEKIIDQIFSDNFEGYKGF